MRSFLRNQGLTIRRRKDKQENETRKSCTMFICHFPFKKGKKTVVVMRHITLSIIVCFFSCVMPCAFVHTTYLATFF